MSTIKEGYSEKYEEAKRHWGGGIMGQKAIARTEKKKKALEVIVLGLIKILDEITNTLPIGCYPRLSRTALTSFKRFLM